MTTQLPQADLNWTALRNFAMLRGQLRVSLTPKCNEKCWFCHNEGDVPPPTTHLHRELRPREREMTAKDFLNVLGGLMDAGLKRVYFTGGEPLLSPLARPVLTQLPHHGPDTTYTLITNGTLVRTHQEWLSTTALDKVKVSLHYFSDESLKAIANTRIGIATILDGIEAAREMFERVELNTLVQRENEHELHSILDFALDRRLPVQFIELVDTDFNAARKGSAIGAQGIIDHLRTLTSDEEVEVSGVGQGRRIFRIDGIEIDVIHRELGRHHVGQCGTCPVKPKCVEGFWSLRVDHAGGIQPCLLREDLRMDIRPLLTEPEKIPAAVARHVSAFTEGTL
ncbi:radical SAM protein [Streptomyces scopuliridis]|uniref:Radical SAM protein n=1 Tax=Streptomyces scopuliridis TaxID=452529 RepID=A0ACD4ZM21_9ACTN|nr:radical SAM protein [Streptomyces scopuliridis]WSB35207.1 radical SAM protein [Streptomyces scopuliridis]WSB99449.1 radical SAM protein [Streptomyces scopuliridis]WSC06850.1 radical SAM protein [Streptomyces scopuliridis]